MKVTKKDMARFENEILAGARCGATMNEADPYGVMLQKKVAEHLKAGTDA
ncbi:hypothetical protein [Armatimonas sp.]